MFLALCFVSSIPAQSLSELSSPSQLILGGISVFIGRGSLAQIYFVVSMESFFLMVNAFYSC